MSHLIIPALLASVKCCLFMLTEGCFVRAGHHSWAAGVISRSAPCVSDELDPLPTVCCFCICLRDGSREEDAATDSNFNFFFCLRVSSVLFHVVFILVRSGYCVMPERMWKFLRSNLNRRLNISPRMSLFHTLVRSLAHTHLHNI